jgi:hypothetical protein
VISPLPVFPGKAIDLKDLEAKFSRMRDLRADFWLVRPFVRAGCTASAGAMMEWIGGGAQGQMSQGGNYSLRTSMQNSAGRGYDEGFTTSTNRTLLVPRVPRIAHL